MPTPAQPAATPPTPEKQEDAGPPPHPLIRFWRSFRSIIILILALFAVRSSIADWNDVPTGSMIPTILDGDRIFVNKLAYDLKVPFTTYHIATWSAPKNGDIVVFFSPVDGTRLVKRCIGIPGDTIEVQNDHVIINGKMLTYGPADPKMLAMRSAADQRTFDFATETIGAHTHTIQTLSAYSNRRPPRPNFGPITLGKDQFFMMGDNRDNSADSRFFSTGPAVDRSLIVGKATAVAVSVVLEHYWLPRWSRFFTKLP